MLFRSCSELETINFDLSQNEGTYKEVIQTIYSIYTFENCSKLRSINGAKLSILEGGNSSLPFNKCKMLEEVRFGSLERAITLGKGSGTSSSDYGTKLSIESLLSACNSCKASASSQRLTIGTANINKLSSIYVKVIDETDTTYYPMEQCESTDEGAMTINEYMTLKNWQLA